MVGLIPARSSATSDRIRQTVALLGRRGYALTPERLAELCLGGSISPDEVRWSVAVRPIRLAAGFTQVGILNEQSTASDDFADARQTLVGPRFPSWVSLEGNWGRLRPASLGVEWPAPVIADAERHAGRELIRPDFDWAGLDYLFPASFAGTSYNFNLQEAR